MGSTKVNITVSDETGLVERNKAQTQENRTRTLERNGDKLTYRISKEMQGKQEAKAPPPQLEQQRVGGRGLDPYRRDEPAAQRQGGDDIGHVWAEQTVQQQSNPAANQFGITWQGAYAPSAYRTPFSSLYAGSFTDTGSALSGNGASKLSSAQVTLAPVAPHTAPALINWTIDAYYDSQRKWVGYCYGLRRGSVNRQNPQFHEKWLVLPAGRGNLILVRFVRVVQVDVDMTALVVVQDAGYWDSEQQAMSSIAGIANGSAYDGTGNGSTGAVPADGWRDSDGNVIIPFSPPTAHIVNSVSVIRTHTWIANNKAIRSITAPAYINSLNPPQKYTAWTYPTFYASGTEVPYDDWLEQPVSKLPDAPTFLVSHPAIYGTINATLQFVNPSQVKSFPDAFPVRRDFTKGAYTDPAVNTSYAGKGLFERDDPFYYTKRLSSTAQYQPLPKPGLVLSAERSQYRPLSDFSRLFVANDGGDPSYCRRMLLAMGFTAADLTP